MVRILPIIITYFLVIYRRIPTSTLQLSSMDQVGDGQRNTGFTTGATGLTRVAAGSKEACDAMSGDGG